MFLLKALVKFISNFPRRGARRNARLVSELPGSRDKPTNPELQSYAAKEIYRILGGDPFWGPLVEMCVRFSGCQTTEEIDDFISVHAESRNGTFPATLHVGQGWNPELALWFLGDKAEFLRAYVCPFVGRWTTLEWRQGPADSWRESGYKPAGRRGCVDTISYFQFADERQPSKVASMTQEFGHNADRLIRNACGVAPPDALLDAIASHNEFVGVIGCANVRFTFEGSNPQDWTVPPTVSFDLCLTWKSSLTVDGSSQ